VAAIGGTGPDDGGDAGLGCPFRHHRGRGEGVRAARPGDALRWRWRVDAAPPPTDQRARGADDRPAAVHLLLDAGRGPTLFGRLAEALGQPRATHALTWSWGRTLPAGARAANPLTCTRCDPRAA
jgi:hypothetical protein